MEYVQTISELMELITRSQVFYMQKINKKLHLSEKIILNYLLSYRFVYTKSVVREIYQASSSA